MDNVSFVSFLAGLISSLLRGVSLDGCFVVEPTERNGWVQYPPNERNSKTRSYVLQEGDDPAKRREEDARVWGNRLVILEAFYTPRKRDGKVILSPNEIAGISPFTEGVGLVLPGDIGPEYNPSTGGGNVRYSEYKHSPHSDGQRIVKGLSAGQT